MARRNPLPYATTGTQQAGSAFFGAAPSAVIWSSTAASFVNLNPSGAYASLATAISGNQQAGYVQFDASGNPNAGLWSGTAASFVNLNPIGSDYSIAYGTTGSEQVGYVTIGGTPNAALWSGAAASFVNLQSALGSGYVSSGARSIWDDGTTTYISGYAMTTGGQQDAILWTVTDTVPEPSTGMLLLGAGLLPLLHRRRRSPRW